MNTLFLLVLLGIVAWLLFRWIKTEDRIRHLASRVGWLESEVRRLNAAPALPPIGEATSDLASVPAPVHSQPPPLPGELPPVLAREPSDPLSNTGRVSPAPSSVPPPHSIEPVAPPSAASGTSPAVERPERPAINWESFLGVKLFAWLGGLALFLGVAFFVKYSFENNLVSPQLRVGIGYCLGLGLIAGGWWMPRERHVVTVQSLCATGVLILYAITFAAYGRYDFLSMPVAFGVMTLITAGAFLLAIRLNAQVVAVLGLLGGFLTPPLLSTGVDNPVGLFGYLALLDLGLIAVVLHKRWSHLAFLGAVATLVMEFGWVMKFFAEAKVLTAMAVFGGFAGLFLAGLAVAHRMNRTDRWMLRATAVPALAAMIFAGYLLWHPYPSIAQRVWLMLGFILILDVPFVAMAWLRDEARSLLHGAGSLVFLLLMSWTFQYLNPDLLHPALVFYFLFAVVHTVTPLILERLRPAPGTAGWLHVFPSLALLLTLVPLFGIAGPSIWIWPVVLFIDLLAIVLAVMTASLSSILIVFLLTVLGTAAWIFQLPTDLPGMPGMLLVVGGFSVFFIGAALLAGRRVFDPAGEQPAGGGVTREMFAQMATLAAVLPFILLTLVILRLPLTNPSAVFGLGAVLAVLLLGASIACRLEWLSAVALGSILLLEHAWHFHRFSPPAFGLSVAWYLGFSGLFLIVPFAFRTRLKNQMVPWAVSALALPLHFFVIYNAFKATHPDFGFDGLLPALLALPCLGGLAVLARDRTESDAHRLSRLALFGGAGLFFITLVFPIQFERQWITIGWAMEGVALLWLFRRLPHPGLRIVGVVLLAIAFARLALNPFVLSAYGRTGTPIWNWYLYSYGIVAACLLAGGWLLSPPRHLMMKVDVRPLLHTLGAVLLFLLLNIEIADYFSPPGGLLTFNFSASFGQDMAYSLAWALFAFAVVGVGFRLNHAGTRYAGVGLLVVTLVKLFLYDLWRLGGLYRIGSLVGLAVVLILVSFIYQRFLSAESSRRNTTTS